MYVQDVYRDFTFSLVVYLVLDEHATSKYVKRTDLSETDKQICRVYTMCVRKVGKQEISFIYPQAPSGWIYVKFGLEIGASFSKPCQIL